MAKLAVDAAFTEFSALDSTNAARTLLLLLDGRKILLEAKAPEVNSSEELSLLDVALGGLALVVAAARLRRVTKRPAEGG